MSKSYVSKLLKENGYEWLPKRQTRVYSKEDRDERVRWAKATLRLSIRELKKKLSLCMDGTIIAMPPTNPTDRLNYCRHGDSCIYRKRTESFKDELADDSSYSNQTPLSRAIPLWGGCSENGFAIVAIHRRKKFNGKEWAKVVEQGKLTAAIQTLQPVEPEGPWHVLCDNESFLDTNLADRQHRAAGVTLWHVPPRSPDLNPVERYWAWLKKHLRAMDLRDAVARRPPLSKMAYAMRVRQVCKSKKAQQVAANQAKLMRRVCKKVIKEKGRATGF